MTCVNRWERCGVYLVTAGITSNLPSLITSLPPPITSPPPPIETDIPHTSPPTPDLPTVRHMECPQERDEVGAAAAAHVHQCLDVVHHLCSLLLFAINKHRSIAFKEQEVIAGSRALATVSFLLGSGSWWHPGHENWSSRLRRGPQTVRGKRRLKPSLRASHPTQLFDCHKVALVRLVVPSAHPPLLAPRPLLLCRTFSNTLIFFTATKRFSLK